METSRLELGLLGPLEARIGTEALSLGGARQRAVLAALLIHAGENLTVDRLIDEVWGECPPPSAGHTLEAYVSKLRQILTPHGVQIEWRGNGYRLDLGAALLDSRTFERLLDESIAAEPQRAAALVREALSLWRGEALAGVQLRSGDAERRRLEELRLQALERRIDAELEDGRHQELVGDLWGLVEANPYRERFVAQLMVALYRSGRKAEALDVYERTRRTLGEDLGLDPSRELQQLSAQIVRQEPQLTLARLHGVVDVPGSRRRIPVMVGASALLAAATVTAGVAWHAGPRSSPSGSTGKRVALVLPRPATPGGDDAYVTPFLDGLRRAQRAESLVTRTYVADELEATTAQLDQLLRKLRAGQFDLVLVVGSGQATLRVLKEAATLSGERIVILDYLLNPSLVDGKANVTAVSFAGGQAAYLAGYLSGLMERRRGGAPRVSAVGRFPVSSVTDMIDAFARGVRRAAPGAHVVVDYTRDFVDQTVCEGSANRQIDRGSHVVFTPAGTCGFGALAAAGLRGVWGVGVDADRSSLGDHVLVSTQTNFDTAVELAVRWYLEGTLPAAKRVVLGLRDDAVGITAISPDVPPDVRRKVAEVAATLRRAD